MSTSGNDETTGGRILDLHQNRDPMDHPTIARVHAHWNQQRRGRLVPTRSDIDPVGLEGVLGNVFIAERISTGLARFRIAGTHMNTLIGLDVRGMPLSAIFDAKDRERLADGIEAMFDHPAVVRFDLESKGGFGRSKLDGRMILMPLRSDLGEISRALGAIVIGGEIGRTPRRFSILKDSRVGLTGYGGADAAPLRGFETEETDELTNIQPRPPRQTLSQHLRLVADNTFNNK